jgi:hypothetical protein
LTSRGEPTEYVRFPARHTHEAQSTCSHQDLRCGNDRRKGKDPNRQRSQIVNQDKTKRVIKMQFAKALFLLLATSATTSAFAPASKYSSSGLHFSAEVIVVVVVVVVAGHNTNF